MDSLLALPIPYAFHNSGCPFLLVEQIDKEIRVNIDGQAEPLGSRLVLT
jgi:hypothetical protein